MRKIFCILLLIILSSTFLFSCVSSKRSNHYKRRYTHKRYSSINRPPSNHSDLSYRSKRTRESASTDANKLLRTAKSFIGTPYKFGGITKTGLDCSGLVYVSFMNLDRKIPRVSRDQAVSGEKVNVQNIKIGDLVFFNTSGHSISHVGIVESINGEGHINFIHASVSRGVMISSLEEEYWKKRFVKAVRIL